MSNMEQQARQYLWKVLLSLFLGLGWLILNMTIGIYLGWLFFEGKPGIGNYIFYSILAASLVLLIRLYVRIWQKKAPHG